MRKKQKSNKNKNFVSFLLEPFKKKCERFKQKRNKKNVYEFSTFSVDEISPLLKTYFAKKSACVAFFATFCFQAFLRIFFFDFDVRFWEPKILKRLTLFKSFCMNVFFVLVKNFTFSIFYIFLKFCFLFFLFLQPFFKKIFVESSQTCLCGKFKYKQKKLKKQKFNIAKSKKRSFFISST